MKPKKKFLSNSSEIQRTISIQFLRYLRPKSKKHVDSNFIRFKKTNQIFLIISCNISSKSFNNNHCDDTSKKKDDNNWINDGKPMDLNIGHCQIRIPAKINNTNWCFLSFINHMIRFINYSAVSLLDERFTRSIYTHRLAQRVSLGTHSTSYVVVTFVSSKQSEIFSDISKEWSSW